MEAKHGQQENKMSTEKPALDYIENYQRKWKEHMNRMNTGKCQKNFTVLAEKVEINRIFTEEMGGKYETVTGHLP
jgi:hypothetical protein